MKPSSAFVQRMVRFIRMKRNGHASINIATVDAGAFSACSRVSKERPGFAPRFFSRFSTCSLIRRKNSAKWSPWRFDLANIAVANSQSSNLSCRVRAHRDSILGRSRTKLSSVVPSLCSTVSILPPSSLRIVYLSDSVNALWGALLRLFFPALSCFEISQMKGVYFSGSGEGSHHAFR